MQMPIVNYCRKCKAEVPAGESCAYCGGKLSQTNEQLSFGVVRRPVEDWFAWNQVLRVGVPALGLTLAVSVAAELAASGAEGVIKLFSQGFFGILMAALGVMLLFTLVLLLLQGTEHVHFLLDKQGVHALTYLAQPSELRLYARFLTPMAVDALRADERALPNLTLVKHLCVPWAEVRRVRLWRGGLAMLVYRPAYWQALAVRCPLREWDAAEAYARKKLKRFKKVAFIPKQESVKKESKTQNVTQI
ncbi:MAG: hypothetical protein RSC91_10165 [Clostridia bacterium]